MESLPLWGRFALAKRSRFGLCFTSVFLLLHEFASNPLVLYRSAVSLCYYEICDKFGLLLYNDYEVGADFWLVGVEIVWWTYVIVYDKVMKILWRSWCSYFFFCDFWWFWSQKLEREGRKVFISVIGKFFWLMWLIGQVQ